MLAEELGVDLADISVVSADTFSTPFDFGAQGSRTAFAVGNACRAAVEDLKRRIFAQAAAQLGVPAETLALRDKHVVADGARVSLADLARQSQAVGGGLMLALGPAVGILINALIYLPIVLWLWKAPYGPRFRKEPPPAPPARAARGFGEIVATIRDVAGNRTIVSMILLAGSAAFFVGHGYQPQMPGFAHDLGHGDAGLLYSMLLGANAAGAFAAGIALESRGLLPPNPRTALILALFWCLAVAGFAAATIYSLAIALLFVAGFLELSFNAMAMTLVQLQAPLQIRGRVIGLYNMSALGLRAFSGVTVGVVGGMIGIHWSLALSAMALLAITIGLLAFNARTT